MKKVYNDEKLDYMDFSNSCLIGIEFHNCNLRFCKFNDSDLSYALFDSCDLYCSEFKNSVLYTTRLNNCDITKADFEQSFLNGIRVKDTIVTYAKFGNLFKTSMERKPLKIENVTPLFFESKLGNISQTIIEVEEKYNGIFCVDTDYAIQFIEPEYDEWRIWRRKSEIAKCIKNLLEENGYKDKSTQYYFYHRKFLRKSIQNRFHRFLDFFWGELFWGYGVQVKNPVIAFFVNCLVFSIIYSVLPIISKNSGIANGTEIINVISSKNLFIISNYFDILYYSILISSLSVFGDVNVFGLAKIFAIIHVFISILSIGLGVTALSKKMSNI